MSSKGIVAITIAIFTALIFQLTAFAASSPIILNPKPFKDKSLVEKLVELKSKSSSIQKELSVLDKKIIILNTRIEKAQFLIDENEIELKGLSDNFNNRAAAVYKEGSGIGAAQILLGADSLNDLVKRVDFFNYLLSRDENLLSEMKNKRIILLRSKEILLVSKQEISDLRYRKENSLLMYMQNKEQLKAKLAIANEQEIKQVQNRLGDVKIIENFLSSRNSPMAPYSYNFILAGRQYGVNPVLIVAISGIESSFGQNLIAPYNAWGRKAKGGGYNKYKDWKEAIFDQAFYIKTHYFDEGLITVDQIAPKYCPPNKVVWAKKVKHFMELMSGNQHKN